MAGKNKGSGLSPPALSFAPSTGRGVGILSRIAIFIDGAYMDHTLRDEFSTARIDYQLLAEWMANGIDLLRTYYYNCLP